MIKTELALAYSIYPIFLYLLNVDKINLDESIFNCPSVNLYFLNTTKSSQLQLPFQALQQTPRFVGFLFCFVYHWKALSSPLPTQTHSCFIISQSRSRGFNNTEAILDQWKSKLMDTSFFFLQSGE